jgi:hypothetical protein
VTQALDLLNALSPDEIAAMTAQPDPEGHIIVGGDRFITIPSNLKRLGVQYDHNMETVTFDCPRYWDDRDMSKMAVYVNYMRSDGYADRYPVDNLRADGEVMHFDWTISRNVTEIPGAVAFLVCVMKTDSSGNEERHWNSELCNECYISKGMESEEHPALQYPDEVTQLLLRMATVEQINVQAEEMQTLYENTVAVAQTAEETKNQALDASNYIKNSYAPAIKGDVSGEIVRVDDVSPIEHDVKCWVHGKNLFDISKIKNTDVSTNNGDGSITIAANTYYCRLNQKLSEVCPYLKAGDQAFLSFESDSATTKYMYFHGLQGTWSSGTRITLTDEILDSYITIYGYAESNASYGQECVISNIQIEKSATVTEYEPYIDPTNTKVTRCGKNLLNPNRGSSSGKGLTLTNHGDGTFTIAGTATSAASFGLTNLTSDPLYLHKGVAYTQSVIVLSGSMSGVAVVPSVEDADGNVTWNYFSNNQTKIPQQHYKFWGYEVYVENGKTVNLRFKVQLEVGDTATEYEPYGEKEIVTPASTGTCTVTSKSPTMTLFTDTPGVTIEAEYNRDTKTYIEQNSGAVSDEDIANAVENYLEENPIEVGDLTDYVKKQTSDRTSVYGVDASGNQILIGTSLNAANNGMIPIYNSDGRIRVMIPSNQYDAANKGYVDGLVGDVESALDTIIAIQNSLIGGDGA